MNENEYLNSTQSGAYAAEEWAVAQRKLMRNVYWWMTLAMALTGLVAYEVAASASIMTAIFTNNILFYGLLIGEIALVFILSARIEKLSFNTAAVMFALYSLINGATLSVIFVAYTASSIASTFFVTAGMFAAMAMVGSFTKRDLSGFGRFLLMALFGLIIAGIVQIFWQNSTFNLIVSGIGVLLFSALTPTTPRRSNGCSPTLPTNPTIPPKRWPCSARSVCTSTLSTCFCTCCAFWATAANV